MNSSLHLTVIWNDKLEVIVEYNIIFRFWTQNNSGPIFSLNLASTLIRLRGQWEYQKSKNGGGSTENRKIAYFRNFTSKFTNI